MLLVALGHILFFCEVHMFEVLTLIGAIVGTITGIAGSIIGYLAYRKANDAALLDLRIKRTDIFTTVQVALGDLEDLSKKADQSRIYRLNAQGLFHSGVMQKWKDRQGSAVQVIRDLTIQFQTYEDNEGNGTSEDLEREIKAMMLMDKKIKSLIDGYKEDMVEDDVARDQLLKMRFGNQPNQGG